MHVVALIPAAGQGRRMGGEKPKAFLPLGPLPILAHTLKKFEACPQVNEILPLVPPGESVIWTEEIVRQFGLKREALGVPMPVNRVITRLLAPFADGSKVN